MGGNGNGLGDNLLLLPAAMVGEKSPLHSLIFGKGFERYRLIASI
jgi:hypothetical protein